MSSWGWQVLQNLVQVEIKQRTEEGCEVEGFQQKLEDARQDAGKLTAVYEELAALPIAANFPYYEPNGLEEIRAVRPDGPRNMNVDWTEEQWRNKFHGAWLGRSVGCALGKPLESWSFMNGTNENPGWKNVQLWFEGADAWPIKNYTPGQSRAQEQHGIELADYARQSEIERIQYMETDDDIRYTVLGLLMLEEKGLAWDSWDTGLMWFKHLPFGKVFTAEAQSYANFTALANQCGWNRGEDSEAQKDWVRTHLNPYREWIGAQIRVDGLAYGAAGRPELAAELAWRDASFSHVKNGIYGAMFVSAMIAAAFAENDPERIVEIGLSEIPRHCRLSSDIRLAVRIANEATSQLELVDRIWESFKHYHPVHTNNNAALCAAALVFARGDFETAITTSVLGGWDTDCNGATVGSIMGAIDGAKQLPENWTSKLSDTMYSEINGFHPIAISECARRSYEVYRKLHG
ncbi:ADP-ribosylglycohydrolase family protein [Paenibacillus sp. N3/727]|uniref:ADP-ribosylglycohydrolase family protein n=1 Tax=Paenibacillus sp. N3/727 TaxID=2925845 RepID=UPI001F5380EE|nr:ADP-ribosylglycohydrolase family protein [Paenibacillus sp. N3/727]UNK16156.1 ADP-ribosylglycohydrolase family protein [Paenibacillus sp. N3/727]